jgi:N-acetylmuramoyl-L-alanine amidase
MPSCADRRRVRALLAAAPLSQPENRVEAVRSLAVREPMRATTVSGQRGTFIACVAAAIALVPLSAGGQPLNRSVEAAYADVKAKEKAVRTALADPAVTESVLKAVRTVVADYEALVRRFPGSAFSDDALWFGGWLSIDAFVRFRDEMERATGVRLWRTLSEQYPASKLAKQVPEQLAKLQAPRPAVAVPAAPPPAKISDPPAPRAAPRPRPPVVARPSRSSPAVLKSIRRTTLPEAVRVTLELDREIVFRDERLDDPARVFVDLSSTSAIGELRDRTIRFESDADLVRQVRIGRHPNNTTRVVLDVIGVSSYSVYPLYNPFRLVIECVREGAAAKVEPFGKPPKTTPLLPARASITFSRGLPVPPPGFVLPDTGPPATLAATPLPLVSVGEGALPPSPMPPARNVGGGLSIARQLGLGVSRIVIDPGHGGHDPGATGKGVTEAAIVLDVALRLEKLLQAVDGIEVILTRRTDEFVALQERTAIANREGADIFLSIHANAAGNSGAGGIETYFLNFATNRTAAEVAARENASSGQPMAALPDFVKAIALNNKVDESRDLATYVQRAMIERLKGSYRGVKDLGVKQAPFVVLIGASMPSVLAEISFVTNAQEARLLRGSAYRERIAEALFNAIRKYQGALKAEMRSAQ